MPYKLAIFGWNGDLGEHLCIPIFVCFGREPFQHVTRDVPLGWLTCIHASISQSPWGHGSVAPDKSHCQQWTSSLLRIFA